LNVATNLAVNPANGRITAVGLYDFNEIRFEPNLKAKFTRIFQGTFDGTTLAVTGAGDLNPHLGTYATLSIPQAQRDLSIGDPRGLVWNAAGTQLYVAGMGSNNVIVTNATNTRLATIAVGQGPCGLAMDSPRNRVYCLNRFDGTISVINSTTNTEVLPRVSYFDPTPSVIKLGRPLFYNTHNTSGLGQVACATCHLDGKMDNEAWDLGDPSGSMKTFNQQCNGGIPLPGGCGDWHPMKGPMTTQTLVGIVGNGPMHWRADRTGLPEFAPAFQSLLGDDAAPSISEMTQMQNFLATLHFPPQPNRTMTDTLPASVSGFSGNPTSGQNLFLNQPIDGGAITCVTCHTMPMGGANTFLISSSFLQISQSMKVPQLRNLYEKTGFSKTSTTNNRGFGFTHDGSDESLFEFLHFSGFTFAAGAAGDTQRRDIEAFLMCFPTDTHPAVGTQTTVLNGASVPGAQQTLINTMISLASSNSVGLIVKGRQAGIDRGYMYVSGSGMFQSDRSGQAIAPAALLASAGRGSELTYTVVALGTQQRMGIDRDSDGFFDRDERDACSDPADGSITPSTVCLGDITHNHVVDIDDLLAVINGWGSPGIADIAPNCGNGTVDIDDLLMVINKWGICP
jgi:YVTN family beta-propeller protein